MLAWVSSEKGQFRFLTISSQENGRKMETFVWIVDSEKTRIIQDIFQFTSKYHDKLWEILKEMGILNHLTCIQDKKQELEPDTGLLIQNWERNKSRLYIVTQLI